jgi:hypothetical protein
MWSSVHECCGLAHPSLLDLATPASSSFNSEDDYFCAIVPPFAIGLPVIC